MLVRLPVEDRLTADASKIVLLKKIMFGTRDAASNWERDWQERVKRWGFLLGLSSKNLYRQERHQVSGMARGGGFRAHTGPTELTEFEKKMAGAYPIKAKRISYGSSGSIKALNRRSHWRKRGNVYQQDPDMSTYL